MAAATATIMPHSLFMDGAYCVCVMALKAQGILTLGNIRIDMNYKIIFISNFWQLHCVQR